MLRFHLNTTHTDGEYLYSFDSGWANGEVDPYDLRMIFCKFRSLVLKICCNETCSHLDQAAMIQLEVTIFSAAL